MISVQNKTILITGAANGIGEHLTKLFLNKGAKVIACDINQAILNSKFGNTNNCSVHILNVTDYNAWEQLIDGVDQLDYLFNVAGVIRPGYIGETEKNLIDLQIDVNLKGTIYGSQLASKKMIEQGTGHIVNFASMAGIAPISGISLYTASKFGVRGFTLAIAQELRDKNIFVTVVCPDAVDTHMLDDQMNSNAAAMTFSGEKILTVEDIGKAVITQVIQEKKMEVWIPFSRGIQAYVGATFPKLASILTKSLTKKGLKQQEQFRKKR